MRCVIFVPDMLAKKYVIVFLDLRLIREVLNSLHKWQQLFDLTGTPDLGRFL